MLSGHGRNNTLTVRPRNDHAENGLSESRARPGQTMPTTLAAFILVVVTVVLHTGGLVAVLMVLATKHVRGADVLLAHDCPR